MTKAQARDDFAENILPAVVKQYGTHDEPALAEAWNNYTDSLQKAGRITIQQYASWTHPKFTQRELLEAKARP